MSTEMGIRILVWNLPRMTREIVVPMLRSEPSLTVVAPESASETLKSAITRCKPDVVVTRSKDNALENACEEFLTPNPQRKVILIGNHANAAYVYSPKAERVAHDNISEHQLVNAIRTNNVTVRC